MSLSLAAEIGLSVCYWASSGSALNLLIFTSRSDGEVMAGVDGKTKTHFLNTSESRRSLAKWSASCCLHQKTGAGVWC